jgi:thiamine biosynthesis protein ThiS
MGGGAVLAVWLNDQQLQVPGDTTVATLLEEQGLFTPIATVAVNGSLLPRQEWDRPLQDGDRVEVVSMMAGG